MKEHRLERCVSHADVDFVGELKLSSLLGLLEQAAVEASTAVGFDPAWYTRERRLWIVRRTRVERVAPVGGGDLLEVRTRVADYRRARSLRSYDVTRHDRSAESKASAEHQAAESTASAEQQPAESTAPTDRRSALVARATTDWVYCELTSGRPVSIPGEVQHAFAGPDLAPTLPRAAQVPPIGTSADAELEVEVRPSDLDHLAHVNNAIYGSYLEDGAFALFAARGWPLARMLATGGALRARWLDAEYLSDAGSGDRLVVRTSLVAGSIDPSLEAPLGTVQLLQSIARSESDRAPVQIMRASSVWQWLARPEVVGGRPATVGDRLALRTQ